MFKKFKGLFIIFMILSLSAVPSINAASDIFDEPVHIDYGTYKNRIIDYIETPDYLKASMPPIIDKNEYVDLPDIIEAAEDLINVLPVIDNSTIDIIKKQPLFKTLNNYIMKDVMSVAAYNRMPIEDMPAYLEPSGATVIPPEYQTFIDYIHIASNIKNIFIDNDYIITSRNINPFMENNRICEIDGVKYTFAELSSRIASSNIDNKGNFIFKTNKPLASQIVPPEPGQPPIPDPVGPASISVDSVADFIKTNCILSPTEITDVSIINSAFESSGKTITVSAINPKTGIAQTRDFPAAIPINDPDSNIFKTGDRSPVLVADSANPNTEFIESRGNTQYLMKSGETRIDTMERPVDIKPEIITRVSETMSIINHADGTISCPRFENHSELADDCGYIEGGIMFVVAIITLILAWVYK